MLASVHWDTSFVTVGVPNVSPASASKHSLSRLAEISYFFLVTVCYNNIQLLDIHFSVYLPSNQAVRETFIALCWRRLCHVLPTFLHSWLTCTTLMTKWLAWPHVRPVKSTSAARNLWCPGYVIKPLIGNWYWSLSLAGDLVIVFLSPNMIVTVSSIPVLEETFTAQQLCENRGGRPGLPVPNSPYDLCGSKATLKRKRNLATMNLIIILLASHAATATALVAAATSLRAT